MAAHPCADMPPCRQRAMGTRRPSGLGEADMLIHTILRRTVAGTCALALTTVGFVESRTNPDSVIGVVIQ